MAKFSTFIRGLCLRTKYSLKIIWRDSGSRFSFLTVFILVGIWLIGEKQREYDEGLGYTLAGNPNNGILIGVYTGSLLTCAARIALIEYLLEKRKKMFSFLSRLGMNKVSYYGFHIIWNFVISLILLCPFVLAISSMLGDESNTVSVLIALGMGSLANSLYIMTAALFFYSEVTGLNVIGTVNFAVSIATSLIPQGSSFSFLMYSNPQSQIVKMLSAYALDPIHDRTFSMWSYVAMFGLMIGVYGLLFFLIENISKNEYGYYNHDSICRKKARRSNVSDRQTMRSDIETEMQLDFGGSALSLGSNENYGDKMAGGTLHSSPEGFIDDELADHARTEDTILQVQGIKKTFDSNSVLESVNFDLVKGEMLCLLGPNGAGKSTLFNIILGNIEADEGYIGQPLSSKRISYCPQHDMGWDYLTIKEHFELISTIQEDQESLFGRDLKVKDLTMLGNHWTVYCKDLSGGYKRRLTLAMSLLCNTDIILMDEPTTALDIEIRYNIMKGISKARHELGTTILYTTHHLEDAENFSDTILILSKGKILLKGSIEDLRKKFNLITIKLYGLDIGTRQSVQTYMDKEIMQETELKDEGQTCASLKLSYDNTMNLANHVRYFEQELGLMVDLKQTSLEDVYVMEGDFENYSSIDTIGRVNLDEFWEKLICTARKSTFLKSYGLMMKKSSHKFTKT
jgi:ABC-2 type transport system ATP-binding protein